MTTVIDVDTERLKTENEHTAAAITIRLIGEAESEAASALETFFVSIHGAAVSSKVPEVIVDFRRLEFITSSCIKAFVAWIALVQETAPASQYHLLFLSDSKKDWQARNLRALACFAVNLIRVEMSSV